MDVIAILKEISKNGAVLVPLLIIALAVAVAFEQLFPRDRLSILFANNGFPASLIAAVASAVHPATTGGKIPLVARFREQGGRLLPTISFMLAGSALSLPAILLTLAISWQFALIRLGAAVVFGVVVGSLVHGRVYESLKSVRPAGWRTLCEPDFCDIRPEPAEWEKAYPWHSFLRLLVLNARILAPWLALGLIVGAIMSISLSPSSLSGLLGHWWSPLLAALGGLPFFFVAGSDVPIIQVMLAKGAPLWSAVSFMVAAPVVNLPVYSLLKRWLGRRIAFSILSLAWVGAAIVGWLTALMMWAVKMIG